MAVKEIIQIFFLGTFATLCIWYDYQKLKKKKKKTVIELTGTHLR